MKQIDELSSEDFLKHPVWEYTGCELSVVPVNVLPVRSLANRLVGTEVELANESHVWACLSNISLSCLRHNQHFLVVSVEKEGVWFHLARYHDVDFDQRGPEKLAEYLGLPLGDVFPIAYDISAVVARDMPLARGVIPAEPPERLSMDELIQMALESDDE